MTKQEKIGHFAPALLATASSDTSSSNRTMDAADKDTIPVYDGDYSAAFGGGSVLADTASSSKPTASSSTTATTLNSSHAAESTVPAVAMTATTPAKSSYVPYDTLHWKACLANHSLVATTRQALAANDNPDCITHRPKDLSDVVIWKEPTSTIGSSANQEKWMQDMVKQYSRRHANSHGLLSTLLSHSKLASAMASKFKWSKDVQEHDDDDTHNAAKVAIGDDVPMVNSALVDKCISLLTRCVHADNQDHEVLQQAVYTTGTHQYSFHGWLAKTAAKMAASAPQAQQLQQELLQLIQGLPLSQLDFLWRILEHDKLLERVHDKNTTKTKKKKNHGHASMLPSILIFTRIGSSQQDRDCCVTHLELQSVLLAAEKALDAHNAKVQEYIELALKLKGQKRTNEALQMIKRKRIHEKRIFELQNQQTTIQTILIQLETSHQTQILGQVLAEATGTMRQLRTTTSGVEIEDVMDDLAEELARVNEVNDGFAALAATSGVDDLDNGDLLAELEKLPDPTSSGGDGGGPASVPSKTASIESMSADDNLKKLDDQFASLKVISVAPSSGEQAQIEATKEASPLVE